MPYVKQIAREVLTPRARAVAPDAGSLNFQLTSLCEQYLRGDVVTYTALNEVIGALESAKLEFYRRICGVYEDRKIDDNGDVYTPLLNHMEEPKNA